VLAIALVAMLYATDKLELARKQEARSALELLARVSNTMVDGSSSLNTGQTQRRLLACLQAEDSLLYQRHVVFRELVSQVARLTSGSLPATKFGAEPSFRSVYLGSDFAALVKEGDGAHTGRDHDHVDWRCALIRAANDRSCRSFVPVATDSALILARMSNVDRETGERSGRGAFDPIQTVSVDSTGLCINRADARNSQTAIPLSICRAEVPVEGSWVWLRWSEVLGVGDEAAALTKSQALAWAQGVYGSLTPGQAIDILEGDIVAAYGTLNLLGVNVRIHFLSLVMGIVLVASALLNAMALRAGGPPVGPEDNQSVPLIVRSRVAGSLMLYVLPVASIFVSMPSYWLPRWHWGLVGLIACVYIVSAEYLRRGVARL
jgi:hypothetical protein